MLYRLAVLKKKIKKITHCDPRNLSPIWLPRLICARKHVYDFYAFLWPNRCLLEEGEERRKRRMEMLEGWIPKSKLPDQRLGSFKRKRKKTPIRKQLLLTEARHKQNNNIVQFHGPPSKTSLTTLTRRQRRDAVAITKWQRFRKYTQINHACWHRSLWHIAC